MCVVCVCWNIDRSTRNTNVHAHVCEHSHAQAYTSNSSELACTHAHSSKHTTHKHTFTIAQTHTHARMHAGSFSPKMSTPAPACCVCRASDVSSWYWFAKMDDACKHAYASTFPQRNQTLTDRKVCKQCKQNLLAVVASRAKTETLFLQLRKRGGLADSLSLSLSIDLSR